MNPSQGSHLRKRLDVSALIVGYAMSRLDRGLLATLGHKNWTQAFAATSAALGVPHNSMKLLRDEFDVFFPNGRRGWVNREPHPSRLAILHEFESVSDLALLEVVQRALADDQAALADVVELVSTSSSRVANIAERLLTGRRAEEHFIKHCFEILDIRPDRLQDLRFSACGFDFSAAGLPGIAIEVKGIRESSGGILFTDKEWSEATARRKDYLVVVVGNLATEPTEKVFPDPVHSLQATSTIIRSTSTVWQSHASVA